MLRPTLAELMSGAHVSDYGQRAMHWRKPAGIKPGGLVSHPPRTVRHRQVPKELIQIINPPCAIALIDLLRDHSVETEERALPLKKKSASEPSFNRAN